MKHISKIAALCIALLAVCGFSHSSVNQMQMTKPRGDAYQNKLGNYLKVLAKEEARDHNWRAADYFASRATTSFKGHDFDPYNPSEWVYADQQYYSELSDARAKLQNYQMQYKDQYPQAVARISADYECWGVRQQSNKYVSKAMKCRKNFFKIAQRLDSKRQGPGFGQSPRATGLLGKENVVKMQASTDMQTPGTKSHMKSQNDNKKVLCHKHKHGAKKEGAGAKTTKHNKKPKSEKCKSTNRAFCSKNCVGAPKDNVAQTVNADLCVCCCCEQHKHGAKKHNKEMKKKCKSVDRAFCSQNCMGKPKDNVAPQENAALCAGCCCEQHKHGAKKHNKEMKNKKHHHVMAAKTDQKTTDSKTKKHKMCKDKNAQPKHSNKKDSTVKQDNTLDSANCSVCSFNPKNCNWNNPITCLACPTGHAYSKNDNVYRLGVFFPWNSSKIPSKEHNKLSRIIEHMNSVHGNKMAILIGHADQTGNSKVNYALSKKRAAAVRNALIEKGVPEYRIKYYAIADDMPVTNAPGKKVPVNRRVEVFVLNQQYHSALEKAAN